MNKRKHVSARIARADDPQKTAMQDAVTLREQGRGDILSDVLGSYTGTAEDGERPEQDADDL